MQPMLGGMGSAIRCAKPSLPKPIRAPPQIPFETTMLGETLNRQPMQVKRKAVANQFKATGKLPVPRKMATPNWCY
jgi:hypothetical protein